MLTLIPNSTLLVPIKAITDTVGAVVVGVSSYLHQKGHCRCTKENPCDIGGEILAGAITGPRVVVGKDGKRPSRLRLKWNIIKLSALFCLHSVEELRLKYLIGIEKRIRIGNLQT